MNVIDAAMDASHRAITRRQFLRRVAAGAALALGGCGRARRSGVKQLRIMVWDGYDDAEALKGFTERTGIEIKTTYIASNDELFAKLKAAGPGAYDLVTPYMGFIKRLYEADLLAPIDPSRISNFSEIMQIFREGYWIGYFGPKTVTGVPYVWGSLPLIYNADLVKPTPESWETFYDPKYKGKVAIVDDKIGFILVTTLLLRDQLGPLEDISWLTKEQLRRVFAKLKQLKPQLRAIADGTGSLALMLQSKDAWLAGGWEKATIDCQRAGMNVKQVIPKEGSFAWVDSWCLVKGGKNEELIYPFIEHMTTVRAQSAVVKNLGVGCVNLEAARKSQFGALYDLVDLDKTFERLILPQAVPTRPGKYTTIDEWTELWNEWKALA
jgi:putative spermidine/putrescine transport system substrate-binding protein/spermidine/putrescine transport system substrate-binding protein